MPMAGKAQQAGFVGPGYNSSGYFLGCPQCLTSRLWRSARIGYSYRGGSGHFFHSQVGGGKLEIFSLNLLSQVGGENIFTQSSLDFTILHPM